MTQDYSLAYSFIAALAGDPAAVVMDFRAIHDTDNGCAAIPFRGTLPECWPSIVRYNSGGYGIFAVIAVLDGAGRELHNVQAIRAHYIDLDNLSAQQNYERAAAAHPAPGFAVNSSILYNADGSEQRRKWHVYWPLSQWYNDNDRFKLVQRKLAQVFDGDKRVIDAARVMRLPGTLHLKDPTRPHLVTCHALPGYGSPTTVEALEAALQSVNVIEGGHGTRRELGDPELAAPSLDWVRRAFELTDPNKLDRGEWIAFTAGIKQAAWSLSDPDTIYNMWSEWCARYENNDIAENLKQWTNLRTTELGWKSIVARTPSLKASMMFGERPAAAAIGAAPAMPGDVPPMPDVSAPPPLDCSGTVLTHIEQQEWFKGCTYVTNLGLMLTPSGRFLGPGEFNVVYGGKQFIINDGAKPTDEAWKAATRSTLWTVPVVDHIRFLPHCATGTVISDELGRKGINVYRPARIVALAGDPTPFLNHVAALVPDVGDRKILLDYLAHNVRYPGVKIPWAPLIQSAEGAGKGVLKLIMRHAMGKPYVYFPKASELAASGAKFNAWLRNRLFILVDEIKTDEKRELIEVLKPLISEEDTEIQAKGVDQDLEDNFSNWLFFSNWKDAIPVSKNGRRYAIMFSPLQTYQDLLNVGMNETYFNAMYAWLKADGAAIVTNYLLNYPIERGAIPMRAPETSSTAEAITLSRGPVERMIAEAVEDGLPGFCGGWISATMVRKRVREKSVAARITDQTIEGIIKSMGYVACGRAARAYVQEDHTTRPQLYYIGYAADVSWYGKMQGYGD